MATYTPNIDLKKPAQSDKIRIADLNGNADNIDAALGADFGVSNKPSVDDAVNSLGAGLAIISNGDIHAAITAGQYVYVRGHGTLTEGLYVATANVSQNGALTGNNVDAVSGGGLNALNSKITSNNIVKRVEQNATKTIVFSTYSTAALLYMAIGNSSGCLYVYSNGFLMPIKTDQSITVTLESDYKTITVANAAGSTYLGILCSTNVTVTVS